jgi:hypothetical protein
MPPVNDKTLSSKERDFLEAARRELASKAPAGEAMGIARPGAAASRAAPPVLEAAGLGAGVSPLDVPTVAGWDHPAAQRGPPKVEGDKWARIAALMEAERREAEARRRRMRRNALTVVAFLVFILLIVLARALIR